MSRIDKDYSHPFCIIGSKGKFASCYRDYLPSLEDKKPEREEMEVNLRHLEVTNTFLALGMSLIPKDSPVPDWQKKPAKVSKQVLPIKKKVKWVDL